MRDYKVGQKVYYITDDFEGYSKTVATVKDVRVDGILLDVPGVSDHCLVPKEWDEMIEPINMKYQFTDFFRWEQPLINQLRAEGKYVYGIRDGEGGSFYIAPRVIVNNIGFLITDTELDLGKFHEISDEEFYALNGEEVSNLKATVKDMTAILAKAKADYNAKEPEKEAAWKRALAYQDNLQERAGHYKLYQINMDAKKACVKAGINNHEIYVQVIETVSDKKQRVQYFVRDLSGKIIIDSTSIETKLNRRFSNILKDIAKLHSLS